jgi:ubiquinone/menaquinone biosynthesis C-methylase UbiE
MERLSLDKLPRKILSKIDLDTAFMASRIIIAAERLQLFRKLHQKKLSVSKIRKAAGLPPQYLTLFLDALVSMGMLHKDKDLYWNSRLAEKYYIQDRSIHWTRHFSKECVDKFEALSVLEKVLKSGKDPWAVRKKKKQSYLDTMRKHPQEAEDFTLDLKEFSSVLDVGGGSGVMTLALIKKNLHLLACILDIKPVCRIAEDNIKKAGLTSRIRTQTGDFKKDLPSGYDVFMFCDIGPIQKNLLNLAHKRLPPEGMIVLVDRFLSEDGTEPLNRILSQLAGSDFNVKTKGEVAKMLRSSGFKKIKTHKIHKDVWTITARK